MVLLRNRFTALTHKKVVFSRTSAYILSRREARWHMGNDMKRRTLKMKQKPRICWNITFLLPACPPLVGGNVMPIYGRLIIVRRTYYEKRKIYKFSSQ
jgi:hypothetical protein